MILDIANGDYGWKFTDRQTGEDIPCVKRANTETGELLRQRYTAGGNPVLNPEDRQVETFVETREFIATPLSYCCGPNAPVRDSETQAQLQVEELRRP